MTNFQQGAAHKEDPEAGAPAEETSVELDMKSQRRQILCQMFGSEIDLSKEKFLALVHKYPDTDAILCAWGIRLVLAEQGVTEIDVDFVSSGSEIDYKPYHDAGYNVIPADVGRGAFDQHNKGMKRGSSFELIVNHFKLWDEPGFRELVELARATDNVERIAKVSIHYVFKSLPWRHKGKDGEINWLACIQDAYDILDGYHHDRCYEASSEGRLERKKDWVLLKLGNGMTVAQLGRDANLRQAAYDRGADCAVFFDSTNVAEEVLVQDAEAATVLIQLHRKHSNNPHVKLNDVVAALRVQESIKRGVKVDGMNLRQSQAIPELGAWHIHETGNLITCGSRSNPIQKIEQLTTLTRQEIYRTVRQVMSLMHIKGTSRKPAHKPTSAKKTSLGRAFTAAKAKKKATTKKKTAKKKAVKKKK